MSWLARFLASRVSGWIAILAVVTLTGTVGGSVWYIKELQREAAYCKGQLETAYNRENLENRVIGVIRDEAVTTIEELESERDQAEDIIESRPPDAVDSGPTGCAAERAPDALLRYHGWLRDE